MDKYYCFSKKVCNTVELDRTITNIYNNHEVHKLNIIPNTDGRYLLVCVAVHWSESQ